MEINPMNPLTSIPDNSAFTTNIILNETNYGLWSKLIEMRIGARNKLGYLTGATVKPESDDPRLESWVTENHRVKCWLIDSMTPSLMQRFLCLPTAKEIWDAVGRTFYDGADATRIFELNQRSFNTRQNGRPLSMYYTELVAIFQEIDGRTAPQARTVDGSSTHSAMAQLRVHIFLSGLDPGFDHIRGEILRKDPQLDLEGAYACVRREHSQKSIMDRNGSPPGFHERSAMVTRHHRPELGKTRGAARVEGREGNEKLGQPNFSFIPDRMGADRADRFDRFDQKYKNTGGLICSHCGEKDIQNKGVMKLLATRTGGIYEKTSENIENCGHLTEADPAQPTATVAHPGIIGKTFALPVITKDSSWIIDTGASEHMTKDLTSPITGAGSVILNDSLTLDTVLVVPSLEYNLLSSLNVKFVNWPKATYPYLPSLNKSSEPFAVIHSDVWGPAKNKSDVSSAFQEFHKMPWNSTPNFMHLHSTAKWATERKNRQIMEVVRASLFGMNMPKFYWGEAVKSAAYLINRTPSSVINFQTPQQKMESLLSVPHLPNLEPRVFGCTVYVYIPKVLRNKLDPCAKKCVFVGYSEFQKGYRCYDPLHPKLHVTLDTSFHEMEPYYSGGASGSSLQGEKNNEENDDLFELEENGRMVENYFDETRENNVAPLDSEDLEHCIDQNLPSSPPSSSSELPMSTPLTEESTQNVLTQVNQNPILPIFDNEIPVIVENRANKYPQRSNRGVPKKQYELDPKNKTKYPISDYVSSHRLSSSYALTVNQLSTVSIPSNVQDALADPKWTVAINEELEALQKNNTWELCPLPEGKKTVGCKWVFTVKLKADGSIDRYKARLVAKGYTQRYGIDYQETFAPVAKINTIRILIALAVNRDWVLQQFDVKNAFLNGDLEEEVYMDLPPGAKGKSPSINKVCKLKKALYGLKQSPRAWFGRFTSTMKEFGYKQSNSDHTLFIKHREGKTTALIVYVDDMVLTGDDIEEREALQRFLASKFEMKDLGQLKYFLGIEVSRSKTGICLSQRKYVLDLLTETGMLACKPVDTPMEMNHKLGESENQTSADKGRYQQLVGKLIYLSHTRPDIAYAVSVVSQFMHSPGEEHMEAVYRILRYLKSAPGRGLLFSKNEVREITGYTDSDWAGDRQIEDRHQATLQARNRKWSLDRVRRQNTRYGSRAAIEIAHNPVQHDRTKHVEVDRHFIKENLDRKIIQFPFVWSEDQLADILTKARPTGGDERLNDRCQWVEEAEVVLPVVVTSEMEHRKLVAASLASTSGLPALVGGGHGGASGVEEKLPMMRGMVVVCPGAIPDYGEREPSLWIERCRVERERPLFYFLCSDLPASGDIPPYLSLSTIFAFFIAEGKSEQSGGHLINNLHFLASIWKQKLCPRISGFSIPGGVKVEHVKMRASQAQEDSIMKKMGPTTYASHVHLLTRC
uniref:Reverse transcriptase Ty1/copia-type domain-containing protein n=1 Tax=Salix viminalis TaxID=40686 RepID=A0A6N2KJR5_SALVM